MSVGLIGAGLGIGAHVAYFYWRSDHNGAALLQRTSRQLSQQGTSAATCTAQSTSSGAIGILSAPTIGLRAPVVEGTTSAQLDVAVGHEPASAWPARPGASVLAAHDVTWFSAIDHLSVGQHIDFEDRCGRYRFRVDRHAVVEAGTPVRSPTGSSELVLVTCWPTNALFLTTQRYVVYASLVQRFPSHDGQATTTTTAPSVPTVHLTVPAPQSVLAVAQAMSAPLGELSVTGSPDPSWISSPAPMEVERTALDEYFAALHSESDGDPATWNQLTDGGVSWSAGAPLQSARIAHYDHGVSLAVDVRGNTLVDVTLSATLDVSGGTRPGRYRLELTEADRQGSLVLTSWQMSPS